MSDKENKSLSGKSTKVCINGLNTDQTDFFKGGRTEGAGVIRMIKQILNQSTPLQNIPNEFPKGIGLNLDNQTNSDVKPPNKNDYE